MEQKGEASKVEKARMWWRLYGQQDVPSGTKAKMIFMMLYTLQQIEAKGCYKFHEDSIKNIMTEKGRFQNVHNLQRLISAIFQIFQKGQNDDWPTLKTS